MQIWELVVIAVGLSMDAFAISICKGLSIGTPRPKHALIVGAYFGGFQAIMPLIGYYLGKRFESLIQNIDHWVAFLLLAAIGVNMIVESREGCKRLDSSFSPKIMLPLALATSIDALAIGVTFAFLQVRILPAVLLIGCTTFLFSTVGIGIGNLFGLRFKSRAEFAGGLVLVLMGLKILLEHLGVFG